MKIEVLPDAESAAREAAKLIAEEASTAVAARGKFVMAVSGGKTPWIMLRHLALEDVPWNAFTSSRWMRELRHLGIPIET